MSKLTKVTLLLMVWLLSSAVVFAQSSIPARDLAKMAEQGIVYAPNEATPTPHGFNGNITDATWDVLASFSCNAVSQPGIETDGNFIYTSTWNVNGKFSKYTMAGVWVEDFTITGVLGIRDLAFDGTYFYGGAAASNIYKMDFTNKVLVATIPTGAVAVRHIGYDPTANANAGGFWAGNWSTLALVSMTGTTITTVTGITFTGIYGNAYDPWTTGGPYLWLFDQGGGAGTPQLVHQFSITTLAVTGVNHNVSDIPAYNAAEAIAGGLAASDDVVAGKFALLANIQQTNNLVGIYELAITAPPTAPGPVTNLVITPGANGALNAGLAWTNPSVDVGGAALTQLTAVKIYRNDVLIYTVNNPPIGGNSTYTDNAVPAAGMYTYKLVPENSSGTGTPVAMDKWIGPDVPAAVTALMLTAQGEDGLLTWTNPTAGLHGGYYTGLNGYTIVRMPDNVTYNIAGPVTQYVDTDIPTAGTYYYAVTTKNTAGNGGTATSNSALLNSGDILLFEEFTGGTIPAGWVQVGAGATNWSVAATANAGGTAPELRFGWSPSFVGLSAMMTGVINTSGMSELSLEFKHFVDWYSTTFTCGVATTTDGGATWNPVWSVNPTGNVGPETVTVTIADANVGSSNFQLGFFFDGDSFEIDYWYIDNVMLSGSGGGPTLAPPTDLTANVVGNDVTLTWVAPENPGPNGEFLHWDDGINFSGLGLGAPGQLEVAARFVDLAAYDNWTLSKVAFFPRADYASTFTLKVYEGANAANLLLTQPLTGLTQYTWNEVMLSTPVQVNAGQELWVAIAIDNADGDYPMGIDAGPAVAGYGDMITLDGVTWESMSVSYGLDYNHNLQAFVEEPVDGIQYALPIANNTRYTKSANLAIAPIKPVQNGTFNQVRGLLGYNVYRDGSLVQFVTPTTFTDMDLTPGTYNYTVTAKYDEGESSAAGPVPAVIPDAGGIIFEDHFDTYTAGQQLACQNPTAWTTWTNAPCGSEDAFVSNLYAHSGPNSVVIAQNNDLVKDFGTPIESGKYSISFFAYIPTGKTGYFNTLQSFVPTGTSIWGLEVYFNAGGAGSINATGTGTATFTWVPGTWFKVEHIVDLDNDHSEIWINGVMIYSYQWSLGATGTGQNTLDANDFFGATANDQMYFDDYVFEDMSGPGPVGPIIAVNPMSVSQNVAPGGTAQSTLTISNTGDEPLDYTINVVLNSDNGAIIPQGKPVVVEHTGLSARDLEKMNQSAINAGGLLKAAGKSNNQAAPATDEEVIRYDDGVNFDAIGLTSGGTFEVAAYWPASEMSQYAGMNLSKLDIYINDGITSVVVKIYDAGTPGGPGALLYSETVAVSNVAWNTITLATPVAITGQDIWIGYEVTHTGGTYPAGCDDGPAIAGFGDMIYFSGTWAPLSGYGLNYNWNIAATLVAGGPAPTNDVGVFAILSPVSGPNLGNEVVSIQVKNFGTASQSNIPVSYTINGGAAVNGVVPGPVASNATVDYTFPGTANLSNVTTYNFNICTNLTGDENVNNNCKTKEVTNMGNLLIMEEFNGGAVPAGWSVVGLGQTNWSVAATANAGGVAPELRFGWSPSFVGLSAMMTQPLNTTGMTELGLSFTHFVDWYSTTFTCGVATTSDGGATWNPVWTINPTGNVGPEVVTVTLNDANVGTDNFQIGFFYDGDSFEIDYWYIDNVMLSGGGTPPPPDWLTVAPLTGTVAPGQTSNITLNFDAEGLPAGTVKTGTLSIGNNSPTTPVIVPVTMTVGVVPQNIVVTPASVSQVVPVGGNVNAPMNIANTGGELLTYAIEVEYPTSVNGSVISSGQPVVIEHTGLSTRDLDKMNQSAINAGGLLKAAGKSNNQAAPATDEEVIRYDDGVNFDAIGLTSGGTFEVAAYWPASEMSQYAGMNLSKLDIYINDGITSVVVKIYDAGTPGGPGALLYSETVPVSNIAWNTITLATPVAITGQDIWIGYEVTHTGGTYPAGCDDGPAIAGFGDMIYFSGTWAPLSGYGLNYNWNIAATLVAGGPAPTNDVGVFAILSPNTGPNLGNEIVKIQVKNFGTASQSNIPVSYTINGGAAVNGVVPGPVASNATVDYTFPGTANLSNVTTYTFNACTNLASDENMNNNCKTKTVVNQGNLLISEEFNGGAVPAGWSVVGLGQTNWSVAATANAGGVAPELRFGWSPSFVGLSAMMTQPLNTTGMTELGLSFTHFVDWYSTTFTCGVATTVDGGATWTPVWSINPTGNVGPETVEATITANVGSPNFQLGFFFDGDSFEIDYWYIDNVMLSGGGTPPPPVYWLTATPASGNVQGGQSQAINLNFQPQTLPEGTYTANLKITNNDPETPIVNVPVTMIVGGATGPQIVVNPTSFSVELDPNSTETAVMNISNPGTEPLNVTMSVIFNAAQNNMVGGTAVPMTEFPERDYAKMAEMGIINDGTPATKPFNGTITDDTWDIVLSFSCNAVSQPGIETDGNFIYTSTWNTAGKFSKYTMAGVWVEDFTISGAGACRDLAFDGTYFYGGAAASTIYKMDFTNKVLVGSIPTTPGVRHIGYDPTANSGAGGFWCGNWSDLYLVSMTGAVLNQATVTFTGLYGNAFDPWTSGGPYLWLFDQGGGAGTPQILHQFKISTLGVTGVTHDVSDIPAYNAAEAIAGGAAASEDVVAGKFVLLVNIQQTNNLVGGYELAVTAPPTAPGPATNVVVTPGASGALTAALSWTNPSVNTGGTALTELTAMKIYRDDVLIYTLNNPPIGGNSTYTDNAVGTAGMHIYKFVGENSAGAGSPATGQAWIGPDVPAAVTSLVLTAQGDNGLLTWTNPTAGLHGGYFTGVSGYDIKRYPDMATFTIAGPATQWVDNTVPGAGNYYYDVTAKNAAGAGGTATSNVALLQSGGLLIFEDFSSGGIPTGWSVVGLGQTNWSVAATGNAGGTAPELRFGWSPSFVGLSAMMTSAVNTTGANELQLSFTHMVDWYSTTFTCGVATTSDGGATWNPVWSVNPTGNVGPEAVNVTINDANVGSANFQLGFFFDGDSFEIDYWYIDDVMLSGGGTGPVEWLTLAPMTATVAPGQTLAVTLNFNSQNLAVGTYTANISIDNNSPTTPVVVPVTMVVSSGCALPPPTNLTFNVGPLNKINFNWQAPSLGEWIRWDDGTNFDAIGLTAGGTFSVAARWTAAQIAPYAGQFMTKLAMFPNDVSAGITYTLKVWKGANAATLLLSQPLSGLVAAQWNEINLTTAVPIDGTQEFWFGYEVTHTAGTYVAGCDAGPAVVGFGDKIYFSGAWADLSSFGLNYNWNLAGYIGIADNGKPHAQPIIIGNTPPPATGGTLAMGNVPQSPYATFTLGDRSLNGYNIYGKKDNGNYAMLNSQLITNTTYQWTLTQTGTWSFYVTAVYTECESGPSNVVTDLLGVGVPELNPMTSLSIFPNPAKDLVNVQAADMISRIKIISYNGKVMFDEMMNSESVQINTSTFTSGVYFIQVETGAAVETRKLVIR